MSKHKASIARRLVPAALFTLASASPTLAEVRHHPLTIPTLLIVSKPALSPVPVKLEISNNGPRVTDGILSCTRSGHRMVC